jgi:hypothetical protein
MRADRLIAEAERFEDAARKIESELTPDELAAPVVDAATAALLFAPDPRWKRRAIVDLTESARTLRALAGEPTS